jgi:hypothetical protein
VARGRGRRVSDPNSRFERLTKQIPLAMPGDLVSSTRETALMLPKNALQNRRLPQVRPTDRSCARGSLG